MWYSVENVLHFISSDFINFPVLCCLSIDIDLTPYYSSIFFSRYCDLQNIDFQMRLFSGTGC